MALARTRRVPAVVTALAVTALAVSGCSGKQESADPSATSATPAHPTTSASRPEGVRTKEDASPEQTPTVSPMPPDLPPAVATAPAAAPTREGDTKVYTFGDIDIRLTPNELGVYTAIHIPNLSRRAMYFSVTVRVTGPHGYEVTMKRSFPSVLPGDSAREAGLLIDKDEAPVPADPVAEIVTFEQTNNG
ncbi:hypothetical protein AB0919_23220 [Streptomyces sp. NPDC046994]|uniref:hypothetical protein n=1 Tax=Streptomyces sp. NPDC046994 TaxID=3155735 RepID=UPI00345192ED